MVKNSIKLTRWIVFSLADHCCIAIYCLLNIYEIILMWVHHQWQPTANARANVLLCLFNFTVATTAYKALLANQYLWSMPRKVTKAHTLLYTTVHSPPFWVLNHNIYASHFVIKQAVKLNGFASKQYQCTAPLSAY